MKNKKKLKVYLKENNLVGKKELYFYNKVKFCSAFFTIQCYLILMSFTSLLGAEVIAQNILLLIGCIVMLVSILNPDAIIKIIDEDNIFIISKNGISKVDTYETKKIFLLYYKLMVNDETYYTSFGNIKKLLK